MRVLGLVGLLIALLAVGLLVKKQTSSLVAPATGAAPSGAAPSTPAQGRQLQQDIQKSLDAAMQPRPMPDDKP